MLLEIEKESVRAGARLQIRLQKVLACCDMGSGSLNDESLATFVFNLPSCLQHLSLTLMEGLEPSSVIPCVLSHKLLLGSGDVPRSEAIGFRMLV